MIFAKKSKFHDAGGPDTVVSPFIHDTSPLSSYVKKTGEKKILIHDNLIIHDKSHFRSNKKVTI